MKKLPVALQLWSVRDDLAADFVGTINEVARIGYAGVELSGYGKLGAAAGKSALTAAGLRVAGLHVSASALRTEPERVLQEALLMETRHVVVSWWPPELFVSASAAESIGEELNQFGARLRAHGLQLSYHNHAHELKLFDGRPALDWILAAAEPRNLALELDVYWAHVGSVPPETLLRRHGDRVKLVHLKDETELGRGPVNFQPVFAAIDEIDSAEWLIVEQEKYHFSPLKSAEVCFEQMKHWGRA
jgi:sugar phosphate isomerase/epimerase